MFNVHRIKKILHLYKRMNLRKPCIPFKMSKVPNSLAHWKLFNLNSGRKMASQENMSTWDGRSKLTNNHDWLQLFSCTRSRAVHPCLDVKFHCLSAQVAKLLSTSWWKKDQLFTSHTSLEKYYFLFSCFKSLILVSWSLKWSVFSQNIFECVPILSVHISAASFLMYFRTSLGSGKWISRTCWILINLH